VPCDSEAHLVANRVSRKTAARLIYLDVILSLGAAMPGMVHHAHCTG
jgi:nitric oxide reductase large subunit